jgi:hypothetical protein
LLGSGACGVESLQHQLGILADGSERPVIACPPPCHTLPVKSSHNEAKTRPDFLSFPHVCIMCQCAKQITSLPTRTRSPPSVRHLAVPDAPCPVSYVSLGEFLLQLRDVHNLGLPCGCGTQLRPCVLLSTLTWSYCSCRSTSHARTNRPISLT